MRVRDIMREGIPMLPPAATAREAGRALLESGFAALPVVDEAGRVLGVVSHAEILALAIPHYTGHDDLSFLPADLGFPMCDGGMLDQTTVADLAAETAFEPVNDEDALVEVARVMVQDCLLLCPVQRGGRMVGFVTQEDLVRAMVGRGGECSP
jgi:CBS domain-containing protein